MPETDPNATLREYLSGLAPMPSDEVARALARRRDESDDDVARAAAIEELYDRHRSCLIALAKDYNASRTDWLLEMIEVGDPCLRKCAEVYDPDGPVRFTSYVYARLRRVVVRPLYGAVARFVEEIATIERDLGRPPTNEEAAARLGVSQDDIESRRKQLDNLRRLPPENVYFDHKHWNKLQGIVEAELRRRERLFEWSYEGAVLEQIPGLSGTNDMPRQSRMSLEGLAQRCVALPEADWPEAARQFLSHLYSNEAFNAARAHEEVQPLLRVRLLPKNRQKLPVPLFAFSFSDDLDMVLAVDDPETWTYVTTQMMEQWCGEHDLRSFVSDTVTLAADNTLATKTKRSVRTAEDGTEIVVVRSDTGLAASFAMKLEHGWALETPAGALAAMPHDNLLAFHHITSRAGVQTALLGLGALVMEGQEGQRLLSRHVYWCRGEEKTPLPFTERDGRPWFEATDSFEAMYAGLLPGVD